MLQFNHLLPLLAIILAGQFDEASGDFCGIPTKILPRWFAPRAYQIELDIDTRANRFRGQVDITINRLGFRNFIVLHAGPNLAVQSAQVFPSTLTAEQEPSDYPDLEKPIAITTLCQDEQFELFVIEIDAREMNWVNSMPRLIVRLQFAGFTPQNQLGLVRLTYQNPRNLGENLSFLYSHFGRFTAHNLFPCYDEAYYRTNFSLTINNVPPGLEVISNERCQTRDEIIHASGLRSFRFNFETTRHITVNQFGFVMGKFEPIEQHVRKHPLFDVVEDTQIDYVNAMGNPELSQFSRQIISKALYRLERYFNYKYGERRLKVVLIPGIGPLLQSSCASLIVADANLLNHEPSLTINYDETVHYVASIIELIARQWFGNIVTLTLDDETWLFEGLIGWTALQLTDDLLRNDMALSASESVTYRLLFSRNQMSKALTSDVNPSSLPLASYANCRTNRYVKVNTQVREQLDPNNMPSDPDSEDDYSARGDFPLNEMLRTKSIGIISIYEDSCWGRFKKVVHTIFEMYPYKSLRIHNFLSIITRVCKWSAFKSAKYFLDNPGFALIKASINWPNELVLYQEKFRYDYTSPAPTGLERAFTSWNITTAYRYGYKTKSYRDTFRLSGGNIVTSIKLGYDFNFTKTGAWVKLNKDFKGYYRVLYTDQMLRSFKYGAESELNDLDCLNLIDDALAVFKSGLKGTYYLVKTIKSVSMGRTNELLRDLMIEAFIEIKHLYPNAGRVHDQIKSFGLELFSEDFIRDRFVNMQNVLTKQGREARGRIYEILAMYDFQPLIEDALQLYRAPNFGELLHPAFHGAIFIAVARYGTDFDFNELLSLYEEPYDRSDELDRKLVIALAHSKSLPRLLTGWNHVQQNSGPDLITQFILTLLQTSEGEQFAILHVLPELADLYHLIGPDKYQDLVLEFCTIVVEVSVCNQQAPFMQIASSNNLANLIRFKRRRNYYLQQLDVNKLVF